MSNKKYRRGKYAPPVAERIQQKISVVNGCWIWNGAKQKSGHGCMTVNGQVRRTHRVSYELAKGAIQPGLDLDHLCRNPACVNPDHLEPVTRKENLLRGDTIPAKNLAKTHCVNGHAFSPHNTAITPEGWRRCVICTRAKSKRAYQKRMAHA